MIPNFDRTKARELDIRELLTEEDRLSPVSDSASLEYDRKLEKGIRSLDDGLLAGLNEPDIPSSEAIQRIRRFRTLLAQAYVQFSELGLDVSRSMCDRRDLYWAHRERALTGKHNYIFPN